MSIFSFLFGKSKKSKSKNTGENLYKVERTNAQRLEAMNDLPSFLRK